jgi:uroporphyrin-III C-methyltransferase
MKGKVYLVGAGPGDPDLLTVKALRLLKTADAVLHDELVMPDILNLVSPLAQLHNVGKRCGRKRISQAEINFLMVGLAQSGKLVVRLKSGDPLIFGRCGEEIEALREASVDFEIVPGISAALAAAAAADIPLTHRDISHALVFLPGQFAHGNKSANWRRFFESGATVAIYMPGHDYAAMAARLASAGVAAETPCAIVSSATRPNQRIATCVMAELANLTPLVSPAVLLIGDVVSLARADSETNAAMAMQLPAERVTAMTEEIR